MKSPLTARLRHHIFFGIANKFIEKLRESIEPDIELLAGQTLLEERTKAVDRSTARGELYERITR